MSHHEFIFTPADFERVRKLIYTQAGIALAPGKQDMVYSRLARRVRAKGFTSFQQYLDHLEADGAGERHAGDDHAILAARHALYLRAHELNPARWSGDTRNWAPIGAVTLNPERDFIIKTHLVGKHIQQLAA